MARAVPSSTPSSMVIDVKADRDDIVVWDWFVRAFHWGTVALVATAFLSPDHKWLHEPAGYAVLVLVLARLVWGVVGSRHARFTDFATGPVAVLAYLRQLAGGNVRRYLGHNPAGGAMVLALIGTLLTVTLSGWLSETDRFFGVEWVSRLHSLSTDVLLGLIGCHLLGVLAASILHRENLIVAMITGRKPAQHEHERAAPAGAPDGAD